MLTEEGRVSLCMLIHPTTISCPYISNHIVTYSYSKGSLEDCVPWNSAISATHWTLLWLHCGAQNVFRYNRTSRANNKTSFYTTVPSFSRHFTAHQLLNAKIVKLFSSYNLENVVYFLLRTSMVWLLVKLLCNISSVDVSINTKYIVLTAIFNLNFMASHSLKGLLRIYHSNSFNLGFLIY